MFCKNCGNPMGDTDVFCQSCGYRMVPEESEQAQQPEEQQTEQVEQVEQPEQTQQPEPLVQPEQTQQPEPPMQPMPEHAGAAEEDLVPPVPKKKKSVLPIVLGAIAAVLVLVAGACALNAKALNNFFHKTFSSPEEYYRWVEAQSVKDAAELTGNVYEGLVLSMTNIYDKNVNGEVGFELGKEGRELLSLAGLAGLDLSWVENGSLAFDISGKGNVQSFGLDLSLNSNQVISADSFLDIEERMFYVQVPELSKTWLAFGEDITGFDEDEAEEYLEAIEQLKGYQENFPTKQEIETLMEKYSNVALEGIDKVKMKSVTIEAEEVEQKCTALSYTIDQKTARKMVEKVLKTAQKDKDLEKIIKKMAVIVDEDADPDDEYDAFLDSLDELLEELEDADDDEDDDAEISVTVYVNGKGEICGRTIEMEDEDGDIIKISTLMSQKGSNFGYEANFEFENGKLKLTGSGKRAKDKINGDFALKYNGTGIIDVQVTDFDLKTARKGYINGSFSIRPNKALAKLLNLAGDSSGFSMSWLQDLKVDILLEETENTNKMKIGVMLDKDDLGSVMISTKVEETGGKAVPDFDAAVEIEEEADLMDYLQEVDWDAFLDNLEESKMPSDMIDTIEGYLDMLDYYY